MKTVNAEYCVTIEWNCGTIEDKIFTSERARNVFLERNKLNIFLFSVYDIKPKTEKDKHSDLFYSTDRNWTDYEMDMYL